MEPARMAIALVPLALYLFALGLVHARGKPRVVSGLKDHLALGLAISGLVIVGPVELLLPPLLVAQLGPLVWAAILGAYLSAWVVMAFLASPRLVVYNISAEELHALLTKTARSWDQQAHWLGNVLVLPGGPLQVVVEYTAWSRTAVVRYNGGRIDWELWLSWQRHLRQAAATLPARPAPQAAVLFGLATVLAASVVLSWGQNFQAAVRELVEMLGMG